jgi:hypothetical protein
VKFPSVDLKIAFQEKYKEDSLLIKNKKIKIRDVNRVPNFMRKPKRERKEQKKSFKKKKSHLEEELNIYERIAPLEKYCYPRQLEMKQNIVMENALKYQKHTRKIFKSDPLLIRQSWLKSDCDLRTKINEIVFKCNDAEINQKLINDLKLSKEKIIKNEINPKPKPEKEEEKEGDKKEGKFKFIL